jgi:hypothetical protein
VRTASALGAFTLLTCACSGAHTFVARKPAVRVEAKTGCPKAIASYRDVTNLKNARGPRLLPSSTPTGVLSCVYDSVRVGRTLERSVNRRAGQAKSLATVINRIHLGYDTHIHSCPPSTGLVTIFAFTFQGDPDVDLWWQRDGCQTLDNGFQVADETGNPSFYSGFISEVQHLRP